MRKVLDAVRALDDLLRGLIWKSRGNYDIPPSLVAKASVKRDEAIGYATADENGYQL